MKLTSKKLLVPVLCLSLLASCFGGGKKGVTDVAGDIRKADAKDVKPPERTDPTQLAQPGMILVDTNSRTWQRLLDSPGGRGAVILFIQPNGPADGKGLARGDLITRIDGEQVTNHEYALTLLRGKKGDTKKLTIKGRRGKGREVEVKCDLPRNRPRPFVNALLEQSGNDAVLHYLRAQTSGGTVQQNLDDLNAAIKERPNFVDAFSARGNIIFNQALVEKDKKKRVQLAGQALANWANALDIDPQNNDALTLQANAEVTLGKASQAKADATKAIAQDPNLPSANHVLARANLALNKPQDAAGPAAAALALNPYTDLRYYRTLSAVFKVLKRKADCAATLTSVAPYLEATGSDTLKTEAAHIRKEATENCG